MNFILKNWWKILGIGLIMYVFTMILMVPMGPGLFSANSNVNSDVIATIEVEGYATHFENAPDQIRAFLRTNVGDITIECTDIVVTSNSKASFKASIPDTVPSNSWDLLLNAKNDGTLYLANALFHEPRVKGTPSDLSFAVAEINQNDIFQTELGLHFPYQPRIVESIRNLMLHVPMWFTMFLLMGVGFVQSILTLKEKPKAQLTPNTKPIKHYIRLNLLLFFVPIVLNFILFALGSKFLFGGFLSLIGLIGLIANLRYRKSFRDHLQFLHSNYEKHDNRAYSSIKVGLIFGILGLLTGSIWAKFTWGAWWVNDPQLNGALVCVIIYGAYMVLRSSIADRAQRAKLSSVYNLFAFVVLMVLLMILPRFTDSLHPGKGGNPAFSKYDLDSSLRMVFYPAVIGWMLLGTWMYNLSLRTEILKEKIQTKKEH